MDDATPSPELNRAGRRAGARKARLRKARAAFATIPAAMGTTALVLGATSSTVGAATQWTVTKLADTDDGTCDADCSLREALDVAADGDTIIFDSGVTGTISLDGNAYGQLVIDSAVTITGPGAATLAVDGNSAYRVFSIDLVGTGAVTISGLTVQNGFHKARGGGIYDVDADLTLTGMAFNQNTAGNEGGAVWMSSLGKSLTISGSTFTDNVAQTYDGGAVAASGLSTLEVTDSTFTENTAYDDGGAIAVDQAGTVTVTGSAFLGNQAPTAGEPNGGYGGAIYVGSHSGAFTLTGSTFTENFAYVDGGAVFDNAGASLVITGSSFTGNSVSGYDGGAVGGNSDIVTVTDSTFTGNRTSDEGGALYVDNDSAVVTVTGSTFTDNEAFGQDGDGAAINIQSAMSLTISGSTFSTNTATSDAGGLFVSDDTDVSITGSTFVGNVATHYDGGAIALSHTRSFTMSTSTVSGNQAIGESAESQGGGIYVGSVEGEFSIIASTISGNSTTGDGGGLMVYYAPSGIAIYNSTISGNTAGGEGGAILLSNFYTDEDNVSSYTSGLTLVQTTITANVATTIGGIAIVPDRVDFDSLQSTQGDKDGAPDGQQDPAAAAEGSVHATDFVNPSTVILNGTIVALNRGSDVGNAGTLQTLSSIVGTVTGATVVDQGGNQLGVNPLLGALADNGGPTLTHALLAGSPAINAGPATVADFPGDEFDQRGTGYDRVVAGIVDVGAFEVQPVQMEPTFTG